MTTVLGIVSLAALLLPGPAAAAQTGPEPRPSSAPAGDAAHAEDVAGPPRLFQETCFTDFQNGSGGLTKEDAARWLEGVEGHPLELVESSNTHGRAVNFKGLARLRAPWTADTALRLSLHGTSHFKLNFWQQQEGVTLHCYPGGQWRSWVAYRTTRRPGEQMMIGNQRHVAADPDLALLSTDDQRGERTVCGTYMIRHQNGTLVMTKGDVRLLTVPMAAPPAEVYLEGSSVLLREIAVVHSGPVPEQPVRRRTTVIHGNRPASLRWQEDLPSGAVLRRLPDGAVELQTKDTAAPAWALVPLVRPGLYEVILEVEDPSPGTGVFLAGDGRQPVQGIGFFRDPRTGLTCFGYDQPGAAETAPSLNIEAAPAPYAGRRQWLRLVLACGTLKCFTSGDGVHWGHALPPLRNVGSEYWQVGLYSRPGSEARSIKLRCLQVRRLEAITSLAPVELQEQARTWALTRRIEETADLGAWQQAAWESQPPGTDAAAWRRACAIATLIRGPGPPLANLLTDALLEDGLSAPGPVDGKLRLLQDAALVYDAWATEDAVHFASHYERLGGALLRDGDRGGFRLVRRALMTAPLWTQNHCVEPLPAGLARAELLTLAYLEKWEDIHRLCRQLRFWNQPPNLTPPWPANQAGLRELVDWAEAQALRWLPKQPDNQTAAMLTTWRHPLMVSLGKEAYNTHAELQAALREQSYRTACQILNSTGAPHDWGLVADEVDGRLYESLPTAVALAMREHPPLRQTMEDEFSDVSRIRLQQAMADGDAAAIQAATVQYYGTPVAAEAHRWLGDRFTAGGQFALAVGCYKQALPMATGPQRYQLTARIRLAAAMLGRETGEPATGPVDFGEVQLTAGQFEQLVQSMLQKHAVGHAVHDNWSPSPAATPPPAQFQPRPWATFQGDVGTGPEHVPGPARLLDWPARQMAAVLAADMMICANRFQVIAYDLATGQAKWTHALGEQQGPAHAWPMIPMRPQVGGGRVYVRLLVKQSRPEIVCLDLQSGKQLWTARSPGYALSDPLLMHDHLFALTVDPASDQPASQLVLTAFDPKSGTLLGETPLVELRGRWNPQSVCQATVVDDKIVAAVAGAVLCCDAFGRVRWVRQDLWIPPALDPDHQQRHHQPPLVVDNRVYVTQPGVRSVDCVELGTGRLHWRLVLPDVRRLLGLAGDRLLIETGEGIRAVSAKTGRNLWHHDAADLLEGYLAGGPGGLLYLRRVPIGSDRWYPELVWLDLDSGRPEARSPLRGLAGKQPAVGPLVACDGRLWCFTGVFNTDGALQPKRDIIELTAAGPPYPGDSDAPAPWTSSVDRTIRAAADLGLPGWSLLSGLHDEKTGLQSELAGKQDVLVTKAAEVPVRLARCVSVPQGGRPRLVLEIGHDPRTRSKLEIRAAGLTLRQLSPQPTATADQWQQLEVDLSDHAGRDAWITIVQQQAGDTPAYMYWKRLEFLP